jgi:hypothetical protein
VVQHLLGLLLLQKVELLKFRVLLLLCQLVRVSFLLLLGGHLLPHLAQMRLLLLVLGGSLRLLVVMMVQTRAELLLLAHLELLVSERVPRVLHLLKLLQGLLKLVGLLLWVEP